jgi:hypothetical protein
MNLFSEKSFGLVDMDQRRLKVNTTLDKGREDFSAISPRRYGDTPREATAKPS